MNKKKKQVKVGNVKVSKVLKQIATCDFELAPLRLREKHLNLLSHGGVLISKNPVAFFRNRATPNPPQQTSCLKDFSVLGIIGMAGVRGTQMRHLRRAFNLPHQTN